MCSIYGIICYKECFKNSLEDKMIKMLEKTIHRGPDGNEIVYFPCAAIGMNRLSIIGIDNNNAMVQNYEQLYSVLNGEIANYKEFKQEVFQDVQCDSEIILPMYKKYGKYFVKKLGGMFSIAIYDKQINSICLWRDPLGIKPLYYYSNSQYFVFASEIKAIYAIIDNGFDIDYNAIDNILRYGFNSGRNTVFHRIKKVLPGEMVTFCDGNIKCEKYWELKSNRRYIEQTEKEKKEKIEEFRELVKRILREYLYSDVKGGFFTSGGLDSSLLTAIAFQDRSSHYTVPLSIRFLPHSVDDEKYVKILENYWNQTIEWVDITPGIARNTLEELIQFIDEPLGNPNHIGTYLMSKRSKELGVKTIITGDGADEFFVGYERQENWVRSEREKKLYSSLSWVFSKSDIDLLYNADFQKVFKNKKYIPETVSNIEEALLYERGERLPEYHNMRLDRMTMAHGIEAKVPFQDYRIVEYTLGLSIKELMLGTRKGWLKEVAGGWLPEDIIYRKKQIFPSLPNEWIAGEGIEWAKDILLDSKNKINILFEKKKLEDFMEKYATKKVEYGKNLWALITLELWMRNLENWK